MCYVQSQLVAIIQKNTYTIEPEFLNKLQHIQHEIETIS